MFVNDKSTIQAIFHGTGEWMHSDKSRLDSSGFHIIVASGHSVCQYVDAHINCEYTTVESNV